MKVTDPAWEFVVAQREGLHHDFRHLGGVIQEISIQTAHPPGIAVPDEIFTAKDVVITTSLARFGDTSYPIANIGSISTKTEPRFDPLVVIIIIIGILILFYDTILALVIIFLSLIWQGIHNPTVTILLLKTSSGDIQALKSIDKEFVERVRAAIEIAVSQASQKK